MNVRFYAALSLILLPLLAGCGQNSETDEVVPARYSGFLEAKGGATGSLFGKVRFPSEYTQRSAAIRIDKKRYITNPDGRFRIVGVPVGGHSFVLHIKGFERISRNLWVEPDKLNHIGIIPLKIARGKVVGRVVDEHGKSATAISLRLNPYGGVAVTDHDGIFQFMGVNSGSHVLTVDNSKYSLRARQIRLQMGEQRNLGILTLKLLSSVSYSSFPGSSTTK